jgi:hypothetical protein
MNKRIGIVGSGFAGLHLALFLQQNGVETTLYTDRSAAQMRRGMPAVLARWSHTLERERTLGVNFWDTPESQFHRFDFYVNSQPPLHFPAALDGPGSFVDPRLYLSTLQGVYAERGGTVVVGRLNAADLTAVSGQHDLMVVASGRNSLTELFPRIGDYSPFRQPARNLTVAYFEGMTTPDPDAVHFTLSPGHGEIIHGSIFGFDGPVPGLFFEGIPGGDFDRLTEPRYIDDPVAFHLTVMDLLRVHAPHLYAGVDPARFRVTSPRDILQSALTPVVRQGYFRLATGVYAIAVGDVHVLNDPLMGQGANTASQSAWLLGEHILERDRFDEAFCQDAEAAIWDYARYVVDWSTLMLEPPKPHVLKMIGAASKNPALASAFANMFHHPERTEPLQSAEATDALVATLVEV